MSQYHFIEAEAWFRHCGECYQVWLHLLLAFEKKEAQKQ